MKGLGHHLPLHMSLIDSRVTLAVTVPSLERLVAALYWAVLEVLLYTEIVDQRDDWKEASALKVPSAIANGNNGSGTEMLEWLCFRSLVPQTSQLL